MKPLGLALVLAILFAGSPPIPTTAADCQFVLGFQTIHDVIPDIVGDFLGDQHYNPENGDALQETTGGLLVWRKADNFTAFTDGYRSWVNGPYGLQERLNTGRFAWEQDGQSSPPAPTPPSASRTQASVTRVIDGDTIEGTIRGMTYTVRYIGVDTPETVDPRQPVQCFGAEASAKNRELVSGRTVQLEKDVSETDRYGRLLRYVYVDDTMVNAELVRLGYARASAYPPDVKYQDLFSRLEAEARDAGRGLWAPDACMAQEPSTSPQPPDTGQNCDPSYPGVCIPPPPPDLDCRDIPYRRFRVLPPDPHRFDGDNDGIGCET